MSKKVKIEKAIAVRNELTKDFTSLFKLLGVQYKAEKEIMNTLVKIFEKINLLN